MRFVKLRSLAKINLDLRILHQRSDGFHELRTVFQTISLSDSIEIEYEKSRRTELTIEGSVDIPDNLVLRAARAFLDAARIHARIHFRLNKKIPMGAGLGGGSSNAAAVLLALPVLSGRAVAVDRIAADLGSDVPFFLQGGTAVAIGRGTESYGLPDLIQEPILIAASGVHVSTGPAYQALGRGLTFTQSSSSIRSFQEFVRALGARRRASLVCALSRNDFEAVVFKKYPKLKTILGKLSKSGAAGARMTGSGSAVFAIYRSGLERERAQTMLTRDRSFSGCEVTRASLIGRRSYQRLWRHQLREHIDPGDELWPPRSRYAR
jgi:4-diphosphocytidyl-2-C-methyl-D-erythritol kinase